MTFTASVLCLVLVAGSASFTDDQPSSASSLSVSPPYIKCVGQFIDYESDYPWFENWVDKDGTESHGDGRSPRATFRISTPTVYMGRIVGVLYKYEGKDLPLPPDLLEKGRAFSLELPEDFFTGKCVMIDNIHVRNLKMEP